MAAGTLAQILQDEMTCPICLDYFKDPVYLGCDHYFCRACISQCWEGSQAVSCPQCRKPFSKKKLKPNKLFGNIVEAVRELRQQSEREAEAEELCEKHSEPLKLFCKDDQISICLVCEKSKEHRDHTVIPAEEAAEDFKEEIQGHLKILREEREKLLEFKQCREQRDQDNLGKTQCERQKIVSEFQQLRQFLNRQERFLLAQLDELEQMVKMQDESINRLSVEISHLSELISEMEGKHLKLTNDFLQDVRSTLNRCVKRKFQKPDQISLELEKELSDFSQKTLALTETLMMFKDTLPSALDRKGLETEFAGYMTLGSKCLPLFMGLGRVMALLKCHVFILPMVIPLTVTLDPDTAHPNLILSEDGKSVKRGHTQQYVHDSPKRFDLAPCVLGRERFTFGRHYWEVEVGKGLHWAVGVASDYVRRKGQISYSPEAGIWAVGQSGDQFQALSSPVTPLPQIQIPSRIQVCLDCDKGQVTFFDAGKKTPIFTFQLVSVRRETIRPWLLVGLESWLHLHP